MAKKVVFSGIQPSGVLHIGNYLGAIQQWVEGQAKYDNIFCVVDLHAITVPQDPKELTDNIYRTAATYLAAGINPRQSIVFVQSQVPAHAELAWLLNTITTMGELSRMTQFKDKSQKGGSGRASVGLFDYPVLMAADILLYGTQAVPVGEDQTQHVELARDLAQRFNHRFGKTFPVPEVILRKSGARIMGLDDPTKKMSKSASPANYIALTDSSDVIRKKIMRAVTDSGSTIKFDPKRAGLHNLLTIYQLFSGQTEAQIERHFAGKGYGDLKRELADLVIGKLTPLQTKIEHYMKNKRLLDAILKSGAKRAARLAHPMLTEVKRKLGLAQ
ncbi:TPA: tryptophan--tRNA ligase [Patescibacteria group bacterium]|uniref:Tryptophan--tRNA ligase n=2 Tax=Bacteria division Kazan-3B-28 TaxID=1798534 RepID=A0A0G2A4S5_UNCK3|nr:MAG: tryptophanyl-tRNA synthetase, tryptophanyl-tRNA synthetase [candidate division Kazan bacterium GW2011_GWA1_50_15]KKW25741.1 MAG: Tryptophan-tRNA ligase [candidate division Kazan bacterium GW2011_GWC1_52_13]KKW27244.1 MAG: Tryptophan-tRNA ligase [candidate division Kazan bacterium GW2011_GWB1_52_7]HAV65970.1 tryptophan--tRNA ligase [Patescibacteria group bacterium]HCL47543.1 tryptophan--tRNA ligase [Patescibacteria group bacterium]